MVFPMIHTGQVRLLARLIAPVGLLLLLGGEVLAGVCQNKQAAFNRLSGQDAAILARLRAAGAANNCAGVMAAGSQRIALLRRVASMRPGVVNCEDATHKNSDRDPPGYDARQIALTQQVMSACRGATVRTAEKPASAAKPAAKPQARVASAADGDCSDVSGGSGPRIKCRKTERAPVNPDRAPARQEKPKVAANAAPITHSAETGIATRIAAELFPEAVPAPAPAKPVEQSAAAPSTPEPKKKEAARPPVSPELTAARERLAIAARTALASPSCSAYERVATDARNVAAVYRTLGDNANEASMSAKAAKVENAVSEMRSASRCGGFSVATTPGNNRKQPKPEKVSAADCAARMDYLRKIDEGSKGQAEVRAKVAVVRMEMMSAGVCNDQRYKPVLRECATASVHWAEANIGDEEIKRRLRVANCPK